MAFSGDNEDVVALKDANAAFDGLGTVSNLDSTFALFLDRGTNGGRIFAARIVISNDGNIGKVLGNLSHQRTFPDVTVSTGTEYTNKATFAMRANRVDHGFQCIRRMGVIDEYRRTETGLANQFKATAHTFKLFKRKYCLIKVRTRCHHDGKGGQGIHHLEAAHQRQVNVVFALVCGKANLGAGAIRCCLDQFDIIGVLAIGQNIHAALGTKFFQQGELFNIGIQNSGAVCDQKVGEQAGFGGKVFFERAVIIQMVARQVGKGGNGDLHAIKAILIKPV